jgi:hypothetical protein
VSPLSWLATVVLFGGTVSYLAGRLLFIRSTGGPVSAIQLVAIGAAVVLLPVGRLVPALAALGLLTIFLAALAGFERLVPRRIATP